MTEIADAIIAGIASEDTALEQMSAIMVNLERAGYVIVHAQGSSGSPSDFIRDSLREAMTDAWNDICSDTDCHPLDIDRQGKRLFFKPGHWADAIAMHLTSALANHSAFADLMASGGLNDTPTDDQQIVDQINYLRGGEGDSVTILCDNPDFNGQPNCAVECNGDWTRWEDRRYTGDTLLDALNAAWLECQQWRTALDYGREKWPPAAPRTPAEGEPPNARNRIEARDKLIETLEAENTRLVSLVEGLQRRIASIDAPNIARALLQTERRRQIDVEGWTPGHDDEHEDGEMAQAASLYYRNTQHPLTMREDGAPLGWPWDARWWKPKDAHRDLVRAGALYLAEQERLRRLPGSGSLKRFRAAKYDKQIEQVVSALASLAVSSTDRKPGDAS